VHFSGASSNALAPHSSSKQISLQQSPETLTGQWRISYGRS